MQVIAGSKSDEHDLELSHNMAQRVALFFWFSELLLKLILE